MTTAAAPRAIIETKFGEIELELLADKAPGHVKNFTDLAKKGFYDGTTFHRVIPGFMIQGGDPNTKDVNASRAQHGTGGPGYTIKAEFSDTAHKRGVLSMARSTDPNSAGSQFFICVADSGFLLRPGGARHRGGRQDRERGPRRQGQPEGPHRHEGAGGRVGP